MRTAALVVALSLGGCSQTPRGDRSEDYLPLKEPWTGIFKTAADPESITIRRAAPRGQVWSIRIPRMCGGAPLALLVLPEERGLVLHAIVAGNGTLKLDPPQLLIPRKIPDGAGWRSRGVAHGERDVDVDIAGSADPEQVAAPGQSVPARQVQISMRSQGKESKLALWLSPGMGIVRYLGVVGNVREDWELTEVLQQPPK